MNPNGPIIIIEDDPDEAFILKELILPYSKQREVVVINESQNAISFLKTCEKPFIILSAINLHGINGFHLRQLVLSDEHLARKCSPYIFYSAHGNNETLSKVYDLQAHGYFHDINNYSELRERLSRIIEYWEQCAS